MEIDASNGKRTAVIFGQEVKQQDVMRDIVSKVLKDLLIVQVNDAVKAVFLKS